VLGTTRSPVKLASCDRGIAIVEFALFLPILMLLFMGAIASFDGIRASRQVIATTDTVADLISRRTNMDDSARDAMFEVTEALLGRFTTEDTMSVSISSIFNDGDELKVLWSEANANTSPIDDEDISGLLLPTIPDGESVVIVSVSTEYAPILVNKAFDRVEFDNTVFVRPRFVPIIPY